MERLARGRNDRADDDEDPHRLRTDYGWPADPPLHAGAYGPVLESSPEGSAIAETQIPDCLALIYEAVEAPDRWRVLLERLLRSFHSCHAALAIFDPRRATHCCLICTDGDCETCCQTRLGKKDVLLCALEKRAAAVGEVVVCEDLCAGAGQMEACKQYRERLVGFQGMGTVLARKGEVLEGIALMRPMAHGPWVEGERSSFAALVPHLQRAIEAPPALVPVRKPGGILRAVPGHAAIWCPAADARRPCRPVESCRTGAD